MIIHNPILTGSFTVNGTDVASITSSAASITAINAYTASQNILNGTYATTGSNTFTGIQTVNSNLVVTGSITAQTLVVQTITSSVDFVTGSTRFGSLLANTHVFSGSVTMNPGGLFVSSSGNVIIGSLSSSIYNLHTYNSVGVFNTIETTTTSSASEVTLLQKIPITGSGVGLSLITLGASAGRGISTAVTNDWVFSLRTGGRMLFSTDVNFINPSLTIASTGVATFSNRVNGVVGGTAYNTAGLWLQGSSATDGIAIGGTGGGDKTIDTYGGTLKLNNVSGNGLSVSGSATFSSTIGLAGDVTITKASAASFIANNTSVSGKSYRLVSADAGTFVIQNTGILDLVTITSAGAATFNGNIKTTGGHIEYASAYAIYPRTLTVTDWYLCKHNGTGDRIENALGTNNPFTLGNHIGSTYTANIFLYGGGNATFNGAVTQNASDKRLKKNITNIPNALNKINSLNGVTFTWENEIYKTDRINDIGVIAQEIQAVLPDAVTLAPFDIDHDNGGSLSGENYLTVYYEKLIPLLIEGIKELKAQNDDLQQQINELKNK